MQSSIKVCILLFVLALASGCVTTTESAFTKKKDEDKARDTYIQLGLAYIAREQYARARTNLERALEKDPRSAGATAAQGLIYQREGEYELAEELYVKALAFDPEFTRGRTYYAAFLYSQGRINEAFDQFKRASEDTEFSDRAQVFSNLATCALRLDQRNEAIHYYERSMRLDRYQPAVILAVTKLLIEDEKWEKATRYYNRYQNLVKNTSVTHSPRSLFLGIQIARHYQDSGQESSLALMLESLYPDSKELQQYKTEVAND